jgi:hypothetical protein
VTLVFESWEFAPAFRVVPEPEFPGSGTWRYPLVCFDRSGAVAPDPVTRWGTPVTIEVHPIGAQPWIGSFASGGLGGVSALSATPSRRHLVAVADGLAYVVDTENPGDGAIIVSDMVRQVVPVETDLLLVVATLDMVALGPEGPVWQTERLVVDDLRVEAASREGIVATGDMLDVDRPEIVLDPRTGQQTQGLRLDSFWPPDAV